MVLKQLFALSVSSVRLQAKCSAIRLVCSRAITIYQQPRMDQTTITKSLNDKREYRLIVLENGLRALLISDLDGQDQSSFVDEVISDSEEESDGSEALGSEEEEGDVEMAEAMEKEALGEKKSAAALCIGVGSFSDPEDIPGFAHFLEHMVFMGSEKYPGENCLDDFVSKHGGETNAWTDNEKSCFYFDVERKYMRKALDKFAHFFVGPLLLKDCVDREIQAVDSEYQERIPCDATRQNQLYYSTAKQGHPIAKFLFGNSDTLKHTPAAKGIDVYGRLREFFDRNYSAQYMTLAIHSRHTLDSMETWVKDSFSGVHNNKKPQPSFKQYKEPFDTAAFRQFYKVIPVEKVHKVILTWAFPPLQHLYRIKPLEYISALIEHEGAGSILSYLKKQNWAVELVGGNTGKENDNNSTYAEFNIDIVLTDKGFQHYHDVITTVFEYLTMLRKAGPQEWFYKELQVTEETCFRWKEQGDPTGYVESISANMQNYAPVDYLTGNRLYCQYEEKIIRDCMDHLRADSCNMMLISTEFSDTDCPKKERWFKTQYHAQDFDQKHLQKWMNPKKNPQLFLPAPNEFIATDFTLKPMRTDEQSVVPVELLSTPHCKLFYKKDNKFSVPKGFVYVYLKNTLVKESAKKFTNYLLKRYFACQVRTYYLGKLRNKSACRLLNLPRVLKVKAASKHSTLLSLFQSFLILNSEPLYPATLASYDIDIDIDDCQLGIIIQINGFSHKLQKVLNRVIDLITGFTCTDDQFVAMKAQLKKGLYNDMIKADNAAYMVRHSLIKKTYWTLVQIHATVDSLTKDDLMDLVRRFLSVLHMDFLVHGNFTTEEAKAMCEEVSAKLKGVSLDEDSLIKNVILEIPVGKQYCQVQGINPDDLNCCITNYYQSGPRSLEKSCLNEVLATRMREPCFNTLRTKHQLGYTVFTKNFDTNGIIALGVVVECQANKFSMAYVDEKIEEFLQEMKDILANMTQDEFDKLIESIVTLKKVEDTHLGEEASRHWREIEEQSYLFDRHQKEIEVLKTLTLESLRNWFMQYFGDNQRKLSIQVVGRKVGESTVNGLVKQPSDHVTVKYLVDPEQTSSTAITDKEMFKNSLRQWPCIKAGS